MAKAITVEGLSKAYQLGDFGTGTLSRDIERFIAQMRGKEDPYLRIGETNDRTVKGESDIVWCLKDLNFDIEQGDAVGIIGRNGAGKSTLLKILSRITSPTTGSIKIKGRIASLLEVGTGFHPELSGRENIYLNGAILGMRKSEIKRKFDEIVDFAGVERYIDTPVKRYSSGMYVRLAFAVAAHLESEILIVDEVLAVGDAEFQKKCLGKMGDMSKGEGRTVLFVSHNMGAIEMLCTKSLFLRDGIAVNYDATDLIINQYLITNNKNLTKSAKVSLNPDLWIDFELKENQIVIGENLNFILKLQFKTVAEISDLSILIYNERDVRVSIIDLRQQINEINTKLNTVDIQGTILNVNLLQGVYKIKLFLNTSCYQGDTNDLIQFQIKENIDLGFVPYSNSVSGFVKFNFEINDLTSKLTKHDK